MLLRVADHEKLNMQLYENDIIGFIGQTSQMNQSQNDQLNLIRDKINELQGNVIQFQTKELFKILEVVRDSMTKNIIQTINELNGGSVSEGKVLKMISDEREKHVKKDLEEVEKRMTNLIVKTVLPQIEENQNQIC